MFMEKVPDAFPVSDHPSGEIQADGFKPRRFERKTVRCPVRVRIGNRQYAAYLDNVSNGGVKLSTACRIIPAEKVIVQIPDLPPIRGELRWVSGQEVGVAFPLVDGVAPIGDWLERRAPAAASGSDEAE